MKRMHIASLKIAAFLAILCALAASAAAQGAPCSYGSLTACTNQQTITVSGNSGMITIPSNGGQSPAFELVINGSPTSISIAIAGCEWLGTCDPIATSTSLTPVTLTPPVSHGYPKYTVTATWTGGSGVSVNVSTNIGTSRTPTGVAGAALAAAAIDPGPDSFDDDGSKSAWQVPTWQQVGPGSIVASIWVNALTPWMGCSSAASIAVVDNLGNALGAVTTAAPYGTGQTPYSYMFKGTFAVNAVPGSGATSVTAHFTSPAGCSSRATGVRITFDTETVQVQVNPSTVSMSPLNAALFTGSALYAQSQGVSWSVDGVAGGNSTVGTISVPSSCSECGLYTAPSSAGSHTVTATSNATSGATGSAAITVLVASISPTTASIAVNGTATFSATFASGGTNWSVDGVAGGNSTVGTISSGGVYTAPSSAGAHTVTATSSVNPLAHASAAVTVTAS